MVGNVSCQTVIKETRFLSHPFFDSILNFLLSLKTATTYFQIIFPKLFVFAKAESHTYCLRTSIKFCKILLCVKVFILTFKVSHWQSKHNNFQKLLQRKLIYMQLSTQFSAIRKYKKKYWLLFHFFRWLLVFKMWSFFFFTYIDFTSDLDFINRTCYWCRFRKAAFGNRFSACARWDKMPGYKNITGCLISWELFFNFL